MNTTEAERQSILSDLDRIRSMASLPPAEPEPDAFCPCGCGDDDDDELAEDEPRRDNHLTPAVVTAFARCYQLSEDDARVTLEKRGSARFRDSWDAVEFRGGGRL